MKILLIDVNCKYSSTGKIVYDLYTELNNNGHEAAVCYGRGPLIKEKNIYKFGLDLETYFHAFMTRITGLTGIYSPVSTKRLIRYIEKFQPDVVHIHELHAYFVNIVPLINYLKKKNIKTIWTFHCEFMYTGKCGHANDCEKWKTECSKCPQLHEYPKSLFWDFTKKMFNDKKRIFAGFNNLTIVTPSQWLSERVGQSFLSDKPIEVIHNGIDTENIFYPRSHESLRERHNINGEKVILAVAPDIMSKRKGGRYVVELAGHMKRERVKFILIGIDDLNQHWGDNVIALGQITNQHELAEYYSLADVFVICSERENFPTTCLEALSCGTPVCGFDVGGIKEIVLSGCGMVCDYGNIELLHGGVEVFINKPNIKRECSTYGEKNYSKVVMYHKYISIYKSESSYVEK